MLITDSKLSSNRRSQCRSRSILDTNTKCYSKSTRAIALQADDTDTESHYSRSPSIGKQYPFKLDPVTNWSFLR